MTPEEFVKIIVNPALERITKVLAQKGPQYARRGDRLSNFKRSALSQLCTPEKALRGMMDKHVTALYDYIDDLDDNNFVSINEWEEKIGDTINYLLLLEGLIKERGGYTK